jgi:hypothetical protein
MAVTVGMIFLAFSLIGASAQAAGRPTMIRLGPGDFDQGNLNEGPAGDVCEFPVGVVLHATAGAHELQFDGHPSGYSAMDAGGLSITVTNLDTGDSVDVNISGPGWLSNGLPVVGTGAWAIYEPIAEGGLRYLRGRMLFEPVSYGVHAVQLAGTEENLCDRVA